MMELDWIMRDVRAELTRAVKKFPTWPTDPHHASNVLVEEAGEVTKAVNEHTYQPDKGVSMQDIYCEAIQVAAMAIRFAMSVPEYDFSPCDQHTQSIEAEEESK